MNRLREHHMPSEQSEPAREGADAPKSAAPDATVDTPGRLRTTFVVLVLAIVLLGIFVLVLVSG